MVISSSDKFLKYLSKMLNISYNKCQIGLDVATKYVFMFQKMCAACRAAQLKYIAFHAS